MKFVILTDTHFVARGRKLYGLDPTERLGTAVERINRDHPDISFVIVTGDLAHWGEDAAYENLASILGRLDAPTILLMGNHDKRDPFGRYFPGVARDPSGFVQGVHAFDAATVVTLDTLNEAAPDHAGLLCEARLAFLERRSPWRRKIAPCCCSSIIRHSIAACATWTASSSPIPRPSGT